MKNIVKNYLWSPHRYRPLNSQHVIDHRLCCENIRFACSYEYFKCVFSDKILISLLIGFWPPTISCLHKWSQISENFCLLLLSNILLNCLFLFTCTTHMYFYRPEHSCIVIHIPQFSSSKAAYLINTWQINIHTLLHCTNHVQIINMNYCC